MRVSLRFVLPARLAIAFSSYSELYVSDSDFLRIFPHSLTQQFTLRNIGPRQYVINPTDTQSDSHYRITVRTGDPSSPTPDLAVYDPTIVSVMSDETPPLPPPSTLPSDNDKDDDLKPPVQPDPWPPITRKMFKAVLPKLPGYYTTTDYRFVFDSRYVLLRTLMSTLNMMRFKSFSVKANRDLMLTALDNMPLEEVYRGQYQRIKDAVFVDLGHSVIDAYLIQLASTLDWSNRDVEKGRPSQIHYDRFEDAQRSFTTTLQSLTNLVNCRTVNKQYMVGIFDRQSFERYFQIYWYEKYPWVN